MAYLTPQDYLDRVGAAETVRLTDETKTGEVDTAKLEAAIEDASDEVDSYLGRRYSVPIAPAPRLVVGFVVAIAREILYRRAGMNVAPALEKDAERARAALRDLSRGLATLPGGAGILPEDGRLPADSAASGDGPAAVFTDDTLAGFGVGGGYGVARWRS